MVLFQEIITNVLVFFKIVFYYVIIHLSVYTIRYGVPTQSTAYMSPSSIF